MWVGRRGGWTMPSRNATAGKDFLRAGPAARWAKLRELLRLSIPQSVYELLNGTQNYVK